MIQLLPTLAYLFFLYQRYSNVKPTSIKKPTQYLSLNSKSVIPTTSSVILGPSTFWNGTRFIEKSYFQSIKIKPHCIPDNSNSRIRTICFTLNHQEILLHQPIFLPAQRIKNHINFKYISLTKIKLNTSISTQGYKLTPSIISQLFTINHPHSKSQTPYQRTKHISIITPTIGNYTFWLRTFSIRITGRVFFIKTIQTPPAISTKITISFPLLLNTGEIDMIYGLRKN